MRNAILLFTLIGVSSCAQLKEMDNHVPPGRVVAISSFKCNCEPLVGEAVQDTFLDVFFKRTNAKPIKGDAGDIIIVGVVTVDSGSSGQSRGSVFGSAHGVGGGSRGVMAEGKYATGLTVQAFKNGELIATHSVGRDLRGGVLVSPVTLAYQAAEYISTVLVRQHEIGRK